MHDLVPFVQFKKREKHPWRSVTFSKVAGYEPATLLKLTLLHGCFPRFSNCINGTKSRSVSHILDETFLVSLQCLRNRLRHKYIILREYSYRIRNWCFTCANVFVVFLYTSTSTNLFYLLKACNFKFTKHFSGLSISQLFLLLGILLSSCWDYGTSSSLKIRDERVWQKYIRCAVSFTFATSSKSDLLSSLSKFVEKQNFIAS